MIVATRVHEADRHQVKEGMTCYVKVPAVPGKRFKGAISKIATFADSSDRWLNPNLKEHAAEILLDETDAPVSPGDSAEIDVQIAEIPDVLAVPVQSVYARGEKRFVFVDRAGGAQAIEVKLGKSNTTLVEIRDGLKVGDRVVMSVATELLAKLPDVPATRDMPTGGPPPGRKETKGPGPGQHAAGQPGGGRNMVPPGAAVTPAKPAAGEATKESGAPAAAAKPAAETPGK
jgi:hypothetical protein